MRERDLCIECLRAAVKGTGVIHPDYPLCAAVTDDGLMHEWPSTDELAHDRTWSTA